MTEPKHAVAVAQLLAEFHSTSMGVRERIEQNTCVLKALGMTRRELGNQIELGVKQGVPVKTQLKIFKAAIQIAKAK